MSIDLDIVVDCDEDSIDLKSGTETYQGIADAAVTISETIVTRSVPEKITYRNSTRARLEHSFTGSFGQRFKIVGVTDAASERLGEIGENTVLKIITYFINEALYIEQDEPKGRILKIIDEFRDKHEELIERLRVSALKKSHALSIKTGYDVRLRKRGGGKSYLFKFDEHSVSGILARRVDERLTIEVSIRRLNTNTGNGRLEIFDEDFTVAFGFSTNYSAVEYEMKRIFSENLHRNNGKEKEHWEYITLSVEPIKTPNEKIVKYIIKEILQ